MQTRHYLVACWYAHLAGRVGMTTAERQAYIFRELRLGIAWGTRRSYQPLIRKKSPCPDFRSAYGENRA